MAIIQALGINSTIFYLFILVGFFFFAMSSLVFTPYTDALFERDRRTKGGEEEAGQLTKQSADLRSKFESRAREMNNEMKTIFDSYREESNREYEKIVAKARQESQKLIDEARARVSGEINLAAARMKEEIPQVAQAMTTRLLSKKA